MARYSSSYDRSYALFSCDGRFLLTARCSARSWAIDLSALPGRERVLSLKIPPEDVPPSIGLSEDNVRIVVVGSSLRVFDLRSGECVARRDLGFGARRGCAMTRDGRRALYFDRELVETVLCVLDIEPRAGSIAPAATFGRDRYAPGSDGFSLSPDGRRAMVGGQHMDVWDLERRAVTRRFRDSTYQSYATRISRDNRLAVAVGTVEGDPTRAGFVSYDLASPPPRSARAIDGPLKPAGEARWLRAAASRDAYVVDFLPGTHVVLAALPDSPSRGHGWSLALWDLDANEMRDVTHIESGWAATDVSPDGKSALLTGEGAVVVLPLPRAGR